MYKAIVAACLMIASVAVAVPGVEGAERTVDAAVPAGRLDEAWWAERHRAILASLARHRDARVVLIGDSITNNYDKADPPDEDFQPIWQTFYAPRAALNLGFSGDTTSNILWRLRHGEVAGLRPAVAIVLIGTNNTGWKKQGVDETVRGIDAVIADLRHRLPRTRILLLGLLPSDVSPEKTLTDRAINRRLATTYRARPRVTYLDVDRVFRRPGGALDTAIFYDPRLRPPGGALHPDTIGQRRMAEAIEPVLAKLLGETPLVPDMHH